MTSNPTIHPTPLPSDEQMAQFTAQEQVIIRKYGKLAAHRLRFRHYMTPLRVQRWYDQVADRLEADQLLFAVAAPPERWLEILRRDPVSAEETEQLRSVAAAIVDVWGHLTYDELIETADSDNVDSILATEMHGWARRLRLCTPWERLSDVNPRQWETVIHGLG
jgi:hypothetical protein